MADTTHPGPLVIAHRGWSAKYPENTALAFQAALDAGADGCECDVQLSRDGVPFLLHDETLSRTTGLDRLAAELSWEELARLDAGAWKGIAFTGEPLPTLAQVLEIQQRGVLVIELKAHGPVEPLVTAVLATIERTASEGRCAVISFGLEYVRAIAERNPRVPCAWLRNNLPKDEAGRWAILSEALEARQQGLSLHHHVIDGALVRQAHGLGLAIWCWTVNDDAGLASMLAAGVDLVTTDRPDWLLGRLGR